MKQSTVLKKIKDQKTALRYFVRSNLFKGSNVDFNPTTYLGHSYNWYELTKLIDGIVVLNNYRYSPSTGKHVNKVWRVLRLLGIKFIELEAPAGLQDLNIAKQHALTKYSAELVRAKYARIKCKSWEMRRAERNLKTLKRLGITFSKQAIAMAVNESENVRARELKFKREERARKKALKIEQMLKAVADHAAENKLTIADGGTEIKFN